MAILIFNVPARTMKRERFALTGGQLLTSVFVQWNSHLPHQCKLIMTELDDTLKLLTVSR